MPSGDAGDEKGDVSAREHPGFLGRHSAKGGCGRGAGRLTRRLSEHIDRNAFATVRLGDIGNRPGTEAFGLAWTGVPMAAGIHVWYGAGNPFPPLPVKHPVASVYRASSISEVRRDGRFSSCPGRHSHQSLGSRTRMPACTRS